MHRDGDRSLQLLIFNEEFLVSASHQLVLITSLPFVHTARRSYRLSDSVNNSEIDLFSFAEHVFRSLVNLITQREEGRSRNKVYVGEPAEGSFTHFNVMFVHVCVVAMYMTLKRLRAWPRVGGGIDDYDQQSSLATFLILIFTILLFDTFR